MCCRTSEQQNQDLRMGNRSIVTKGKVKGQVVSCTCLMGNTLVHVIS